MQQACKKAAAQHQHSCCQQSRTHKATYVQCRHEHNGLCAVAWPFAWPSASFHSYAHKVAQLILSHHVCLQCNLRRNDTTCSAQAARATSSLEKSATHMQPPPLTLQPYCYSSQHVKQQMHDTSDNCKHSFFSSTFQLCL